MLLKTNKGPTTGDTKHFGYPVLHCNFTNNVDLLLTHKKNLQPEDLASTSCFVYKERWLISFLFSKRTEKKTQPGIKTISQTLPSTTSFGLVLINHTVIKNSFALCQGSTRNASSLEGIPYTRCTCVIDREVCLK